MTINMADSMSSVEILDLLAKSFEITGQERAIVLGNLNLEFVYVTRHYLKLMGNPQIIGKQLKDTDHPGVKYTNELRKIALNVIKTGKRSSYFIIYQLPNTSVKRCYINHCSLLKHPETNVKIGIMAEIEPFNCKYIGNILNIANRFILPSNGQIAPRNSLNKEIYSLTEREREVLFLLMLGRSYKEIACIINSIYDKSISSSAINSIIRINLFTKFKTSSVSDLIQLTATNSIIQDVPPNLLKFSEGIFEIDYF